MTSTRHGVAGNGRRGLTRRNCRACRLLLTIVALSCFVFRAPPVALTIRALPFTQMSTACQSFPDLVKNGDRTPVVASPAASCPASSPAPTHGS